MDTPSPFGAIARFDDPAALVRAARRLREAGFRRVDAHSPFPIHGIDEALGLGRSKLPWIVLLGGLIGGGSGYLMQWYLSAVEYPLIVYGKPYNSVEAWVPITFELTILLAAFGAVFGMFAMNGLPKLYHPAFANESFNRVTDDGFFVTVEASDPMFDAAGTPGFLRELGGADVALLEG